MGYIISSCVKKSVKIASLTGHHRLCSFFYFVIFDLIKVAASYDNKHIVAVTSNNMVRTFSKLFELSPDRIEEKLAKLIEDA